MIKPPIACVTGATGMIGRRIVERLLSLGYQVRVLTRRHYVNPHVSVVNASLSDDHKLDEFISGADAVFHCAAELQDDSKMWAVNVLGTGKITELVHKYQVKYYCYLSSAGVVGRTSQLLVDESTPCHPQNRYEETKLEAEKLASRRIEGCSTIILRPTNVVDCEHLGELSLAVDGSMMSRLKAFVKGAECAHIVHAEDVADAAIFFLDQSYSPAPRVFFVSIDDDPLNTVAALWSMYRGLAGGGVDGGANQFPHLPVVVPFALRWLAGRSGNSGVVKYSSQRLASEGFTYSYGARMAVKKIFLDRSPVLNE